MTNAGLVLLLSSVGMAALGAALFVRSRHSAHTSQGASLALFSHGAFATAGLLFVVSLFHVHSLSPFVIHLHSLGEALSADFDCDLSLECVAVSSLLIAGIVLGVSALLGQLSSQALLRQCRLRRVPEDGLPAGAVPPGTEVWVVQDRRPDAFAIATVRISRRRVVRVQDTIVMTTALRALLDEAELRVTLAHEAAHVRAHDSRYLPLVRTISSLLFLDPVLRVLAGRLSSRYEFGADEDAAWSTRNPRALASALVKLASVATPPFAAASILGGRRRPLLLERIERLLALADSMDS